MYRNGSDRLSTAVQYILVGGEFRRYVPLPKHLLASRCRCFAIPNTIFAKCNARVISEASKKRSKVKYSFPSPTQLFDTLSPSST